MVVRRCPKSGSPSDDVYGFCIRCGYEFPKIEVNANTCPLCQYQNPDEAEFCVKCGTPLIFKKQLKKEDGTEIKPVIIQSAPNQISLNTEKSEAPRGKYSTIIIIFGYIFSILGGLLGIIIAIYLSTRKNPTERRHGHIQLGIFLVYLILIAILFATGQITPDVISNYTQLVSGNLTSI